MTAPLIRPMLPHKDGEPTGVSPSPAVAIRVGTMEVRLAETQAEIEAAQALRYRIFYEEMAAQPTGETARLRLDADRFDEHCEHLLVIDHSLGAGAETVVGTYRFLRRSRTARIGRFYSEDEYDIRRLLEGDDEIMEVGRSCVDIRYRRHQTMQLLWRGIAQYVQYHDVTLMFGCASFHGTDPAEHALPLSFLHYECMAPIALRPEAVRDRYVSMRLMEREAVDQKAAIAALPPLIKGYLRLGGFVGDGAVIDEQFNTTDVCVLVKTDLVTGKYVRRYNRDDATRAAEPDA